MLFRSIGFEAQVPDQLIRIDLAVDPPVEQARQAAPRSNDRIQQAPGSKPITKLEAICYEPPNSQELSQRAHNMVEPLTDKYDLALGRNQLKQPIDTLLI